MTEESNPQVTESNLALRIVGGAWGVTMTIGGVFLYELAEAANSTPLKAAAPIVSLLGAGAVVASLLDRD